MNTPVQWNNHNVDPSVPIYPIVSGRYHQGGFVHGEYLLKRLFIGVLYPSCLLVFYIPACSVVLYIRSSMFIDVLYRSMFSGALHPTQHVYWCFVSQHV